MQQVRSIIDFNKDQQIFFFSFSFIAFLVFTLPTEINDTIRAFRPVDYPQAKGATALITAIFIAMGQLNHAIHFYIYTLTGGIFRNELIKLFTFSRNETSKSIRTTITTAPSTRQTLLRKKPDDPDQHVNVIEDR